MTPTHTGIGFGWTVRPAPRRLLRMALALVLASAASAVLLVTPSSTGCPTLSQATAGPDVRVTALPGVDLRPVLRGPGLAAASGPYLGVASALHGNGAAVGTWIEGRPRRAAAVDRPLLISGTWPTRGEIALDVGLARRLGYRSGERAIVTTASGKARMRVAGITRTSGVTRAAGVPGLAYVLPRDLRKVAPAEVHSSTLLLQTTRQTSAVAHRLARQYPGPQALIDSSFGHRCVST